MEPQFLIFENAVNLFQMHSEATTLGQEQRGGCCGIRAMKTPCLVQGSKIISRKNLIVSGQIICEVLTYYWRGLKVVMNKKRKGCFTAEAMPRGIDLPLRQSLQMVRNLFTFFTGC